MRKSNSSTPTNPSRSPSASKKHSERYPYSSLRSLLAGTSMAVFTNCLNAVLSYCQGQPPPQGAFSLPTCFIGQAIGVTNGAGLAATTVGAAAYVGAAV